MKTITLNRNLVTIVDDENYDWLNAHRWFAKGSPRRRYVGRTRRTGGTIVHLQMHRLIVDAADGRVVDHINRDPLDNRRENLRIVTPSASAHNRGTFVTNRSGYIGVTWHARAGKWQAQFGHGGRYFYLGLFATPEEAALAYDAKALELAPDHATLNFGRGG